jgi:hypothetical protein
MIAQVPALRPRLGAIAPQTAALIAPTTSAKHSQKRMIGPSCILLMPDPFPAYFGSFGRVYQISRTR